MREIEFRAWHKKYNFMVRVTGINMICSDAISIQYNTVNIRTRSGQIWTALKNVELMQYTGLKDKNGVKIFEGDIVKCKVHSFDNETWEIDDIGEVVYDDDCCAYFINFNEGCIHLTSAWNLKVIGNIYESKELLGNE